MRRPDEPRRLPVTRSQIVETQMVKCQATKFEIEKNLKVKADTPFLFFSFPFQLRSFSLQSKGGCDYASRPLLSPKKKIWEK